MNFNRRNLLKGGAAAVASLPFASAIAKPYSKDIRWDKETDVLVVGYAPVPLSPRMTRARRC